MDWEGLNVDRQDMGRGVAGPGYGPKHLAQRLAALPLRQGR